MTVARYYSSTAVQTQLSAQISASDAVMTVASVTGFPVSYPYTLILDLGTDSEEIVEVTAAAGTTLTMTRGIDSTTPLSHSVGATVVHGVSARDHREAQEHIAATDGVHGLAPASSVVGTTDTQTLTGKTLTSPTITDPSIDNPTITSGSMSNATITSPTITGGSHANGSFSGATLTTSTLTAPTIGDFTNANHTHSGVSSGGTGIPQTSVTGLDSRITAVESKNTSQDATLTTNGNRLTALELNKPVYVRKTANTSRSNTNITANDPELTISLAASAVYFVEMFIRYAAVDDATSAGIVTTWAVPSGATGNRTTTGAGSNQTQTSADNVSGRFGVHGFGTPIGYGSRGDNTLALLATETGIVTTTTAGTLALQWAQDVSNAAATTVFLDSLMRVTRLS